MYALEMHGVKHLVFCLNGFLKEKVVMTLTKGVEVYFFIVTSKPLKKDRITLASIDLMEFHPFI